MEVDKQFHSRERGSSEGEKAQNDRKDTLKLLGSAQEKKRKDSSCTKGGTAGKGKYIVSITKRNEIIVPPACLEKFWASCLSLGWTFGQVPDLHVREETTMSLL